MNVIRLRLLLVVALLTICVLPTAARAARPVFIGDMFHAHVQQPKTLGLWASDGLVRLRWSGWGTSVARATGKVTTHSQGVYHFSAARAIASDVGICNGRVMYTRLRYKAFGRWHDALLDGCRFSATS
jgi:hypothetical protein